MKEVIRKGRRNRGMKVNGGGDLRVEGIVKERRKEVVGEGVGV